MNILFIVPYTPNLIRVRPFNLIRSLAARGHRITLATLWSNEAERKAIDGLQSICHRVVAFPLPRWRSALNCVQAIPTRTPLQAVYCWQPALARQLATMVSTQREDKFDVVHIEHLRGVRYGLHLKRQQNHRIAEHIPIVWDSVDCISHLFQQASEKGETLVSRMGTRFELARTQPYESWLLAQFDRVLVTSPEDRDAFLSMNNRPSLPNQDPITVLPNGVDLDYFTPSGAIDREPATLVVSGKMSYHANVSMVLHLVQHIMPRIWEHRPKVRLVIVGKDPPGDIRALSAHPNISVTGTVADIRPYLRQATIAVAPLTYGAGIQNKILEAMACRTPVITTLKSLTAIRARAGEEVWVADTPQEFSSAVLRLLDDREAQQRLGYAGRRFVERHHHWEAIAARLDAIYHSVMSP